jgi:signal transduction histidine kinase
MSAQTESYTRLHGRWLALVQAAWFICAVLTAIILISTVPVYYSHYPQPIFHYPQSIPSGLGQFTLPFQILVGLGDLAESFMSFGLAILLFWRKPNDRMALFASFFFFSVAVSGYILDHFLTTYFGAPSTRNLSAALSFPLWILLFCVFPDGRFVPRWSRWLFLVSILTSFSFFVVPFSILQFTFGPQFILVTYAQVYRYRHVSSNVERQQTKWVVFGWIMVMALSILTSLIYKKPTGPLIDIFPLMLTIAILRSGLWNIDIIINRTLVYGALTAGVVSLYVLVVGGLSIALQTQNNLLGIIIAVLVIAFLFQPLRRRLQDIVDRFAPVPEPVPPELPPTPISNTEPTQPITEPAQTDPVIENTPQTILRGHWLPAARLAWGIMFVALTVMYVLGFLAVHQALSTVCEAEPCTLRQQIRHTDAGDQVMDWGGPPEGYADPLRPNQVKALDTFGLTLDQYGWLGALQLGIPALMYLLIAAGLFWWKSDDWMALLMSTMVMTLPFVDMPLPYTVLVRQPIWEWIYIPADFVAVACFFIFPLIFPTGRFVPRWTRWKALFDIAFAIYDTLSRNYILRLPPGWDTFILSYIILSLVINAYAQSYRYARTASPVERQQIKWVVVGVVGYISIALPVDRFLYYHPIIIDSARALALSAIPDTIYRAITLFIPISIAIPVLRYRLWDIDIFINRAFVYGALTASAVASYVLIVGLSSIGLQAQNSLAGSVFAILAIAFLFQPLRQRLQRIADRFVPMPQSAPHVERHKPQIAITESQDTDITLRGRWLLIARLAWIIAFIALAMMYVFGFEMVHDVLSTVCEGEPCTLMHQIRHTAAGDQVMDWDGPAVGFADPLRPDQVRALETLGLTLDQYGWLGALQMGIPALIFLLIAAGLFWRKSDNWMALFVSVMVATTPLWAMPLPFTLAVRQPAWEWVVALASFVSQSSDLTFPLIFPNGRFVPRWTRWMLPVVLIYSAFWSFYRPLVEHPRADEFITVITILIFSSIAVYAQVYRYFRVASPLERQQLKWIVVGYTGLILTALLVVLPLNEFLTSRAGSMDPARALILSAILDTLSNTTTFFTAVGILIAVLRYRLWDVDILINRTLVYGTLTGIIVIAFVIIVGFLSLLVQSNGNSIVTIVATGLVALLFQPLRQRLQGSINRLMYGDRDDPYAALSRLGRRLEASITPEAVLPTIVTTVRETLKLPYTAIYLKQPDDDYKIIAESASPSLRVEDGKIRVPGMNREGQCIPLIHQGETLGCLVLGPRTPNEAFTSSDLRLVDDLAPQVGVAVHAMRLTSDLQRSREQLVLTREEERRRLRRDLHDGLGPNLASQGLKLAAVQQLLESNPSAAKPLLEQVMEQNKSTVDDVRRLVYGLRPPALDELGLVAAIRDHVAGMDGKFALQIEITEPLEGLPPLSAGIEVAAFRIVLEALTNVIRHAQAKYCAIRFSLSHNGSNDILQTEIQDDGKGMPDDHRAGVGLRSMRERAEELGGSCSIESDAIHGTRVLVCLPIGESNRSVPNSDD